MNHILQMLSKLLSVAKEAIDRQGLIAILTISVGNDDEIDKSEQAITVYNELIDKLQLNIPKDVDYRPNIYSYFGIQKKPNDTILVEMMISIFHIKRFDSELFIFKDIGWQKVNEDELQGLISKMIQVLLIDYKPSLSTLTNIVNGLQKSTDVEELIEDKQYIGCGPSMFNLNTFEVVKNCIDIFPKTRLNIEIDKGDVINENIPDHFSKYMLELANFDTDLKHFLIQHTAILLTANTKLRRGLILHGAANNGKSVYIKLLKSFFHQNDVISKTLNELGGRFDKESLIGKRLMASDEIGEARINEKVVNDFKKLLSLEPIHVDRKGQTQVEVTLDLKLIFNTNAVLNFPSEHAKALERRIAVIPCEYYVEKADPDLIEKLQDEKKEIFLYLMYVYQQIVKADIEYLENSRVTEITHDWLNFGYEFVSSRSVSIPNQKACINLLRKLTAIKPGSRIKVSRLNEVIRDEIKVSSQVINDLVQANFNVQSRLNNGYKYWIDLGWKETDKKDDMISFDENENVTDDEFLYEDDLNLGWEDFDDE
ncbi:TPA: DNA primase [Staphylococcus aureus]|nr:DNA primase [Staphylococcus aureus]HDA3130796.1 DNA primase [Staphylococcus aureus]HDA3130954.1 DNA primase [Staphylococcus aureus]